MCTLVMFDPDFGFSQGSGQMSSASFQSVGARLQSCQVLQFLSKSVVSEALSSRDLWKHYNAVRLY